MRRAALVFGLALLAAPAAFAGLFSAPEPELIYSGSGVGLEEGVLVIRDAEAFALAVKPLDPAFGAPEPDFKKVAVLRIVGRARENRCRDTALLEVSTKGSRAVAKVEERIPNKDCACSPDPRPSRVFLVTVAHMVKKADVEKTDQVIPCPEAFQQRKVEAQKPSILFEGSWGGEPGGKLIIDQAEFRKVLVGLGIPDRGPEVDFEKDRVIAVTGRPRENACRDTKVVAARLDNPEEATFEVEEVVASVGANCPKASMQPRLFLYRVPATVMRVKVSSRDAN